MLFYYPPDISMPYKPDRILPRLIIPKIIISLRNQSFPREIRAELVTTDKLDSCPTESDKIDMVDYGFQMCVMGLGPGGVRSIRCFALPENIEASGDCEKNEEDFRVTRFDGGAVYSDSFSEAIDKLLANPTDLFEACGSASIQFGSYNAVGAACESSVISQEAAAYKAQQVASARAAEDLRRNGQNYFGGFASGACFATTEPFL